MEDETTLPPLPPLTSGRYAPLVVPITLAAVANVIVPEIIVKAFVGRWWFELPVGWLIVGFFAGQFGLLATWAVLGPWRLYPQWFAALLVGLGLFLAVVLGLSLVGQHVFPPRWKEFLQVILAIFALLVAAQLPLWLIRLLRGWRLVLRGADAARTAIESRQLQIREIFIAMTILAVALGTMNLVFGRGGSRHVERFLIEFLTPCGVTVIWSALVLPICLWVCFGASAIGVRIAVLLGYLIAVTTIVMGVVLAVSGDAPPEAIGFVLLLHVGLLATVFSGLGLARACGYVLVSVRSARRQWVASDGERMAAP